MLYLTVNPDPGHCKLEGCSGPHPYYTKGHLPVAVACVEHDGFKGLAVEPLPDGAEYVVPAYAGRSCSESCPKVPEGARRESTFVGSAMLVKTIALDPITGEMAEAIS